MLTQGSHARRFRRQALHIRAPLAIAVTVTVSVLAGSMPGAAQLLASAKQSLETPVALDQDSSHFGDQLAWVDTNGDGRDDLVTSHWDRSADLHRVEVYLADTTGSVSLAIPSASFSEEPILAGCDIDPTTPGEEVIIALPDADVAFNGSVSSAGAVLIYDWNTSPFPTLLATWTQADTHDELPETNDDFGRSLATGDFDADGICDVAIGTPNEDLDEINNVGVVHVRYGPRAGGSWSSAFSKTLPMGTSVAAGDRFGLELAAGDFDGTDGDDLAIGNPEDNGADNDAGSVWVFYIDALRDFSISGYLSSDVGLDVDNFNGFGEVLAAGDLDGDGFDELAVGAPFHRVGGTSGPRSGTVTVLYGGLNGLDTGPFVNLTIANAGGFVQSGDDFGIGLAIGRLYGGIGSDLAVAAGGLTRGGAVAVFRGDDELSFVDDLDQGDLGDDADSDDDFGETLRVGEPGGGGQPVLAIGAPGEDYDPPARQPSSSTVFRGGAIDLAAAGSVRGTPAGGDLGAVHLVPTPDRLRSAEVVMLEDAPFFGQHVDRIGVPQPNTAGQAALQLRNDALQDFVVTTDALIASGPDMSSEVGLDEEGNLAWLDLSDGELLVSSRGVVFEDGTPSPVGGLFSFSSSDQLRLRGSEQLYLLTELQAPLRRVLLHTDLTTGTSTELLAQGDVLQGEEILDITQLAVSPDGVHWAALVDLASGDGFVHDGLLVSNNNRGGANLELLQVVIDNDGAPAIAALNGTSGGLVAGDHWQLFNTGGSVGNLPLGPYLPQSAALSAFGELSSIWGREGFSGEVLALLCPEGQPASGVPEGIVATIGERVLFAGDRLDTDEDGLADATVEHIDRAVRGAPEVSRAGEITLRLDLRFDDNPLLVRKALVRMDSPVCAAFADGFESGNALSWYSVTP